MVKVEYFKHYKTKQISAAITLLFCIFFLPAITSSAFLPSLVNAGSGAADSQSSDIPGAEPSASLQEDIHLERKTPFFSKNTLINMQLFLENFSQLAYWRLTILNINKIRLVHDLKKTFRTLARISGFTSITRMLSMLFIVFAIAAVFDRLFRFFVLKKLQPESPAETLSWHWKLWLGLVNAAPEVVSILFFTTISYLAYILFYSDYFSIICPSYLTILVTIIFIRITILLSAILLSPVDDRLRLVPWDDETAMIAHRINSIFVTVLTIGLMSIGLLKYGGLKGDSLFIIKFLSGTMFILMTGLLLVLNRKTITRKLFKDSVIGGSTWLYLLETYLFILWVIWSGKLLLSDSQFTLAFSVSLLIIPIFLVLDSLIGWFFRFFTHVLSGDREIEETDVNEEEIVDKPGLLYSYLRSLSRLVLTGLLLLWLLHLWGFENTYAPLAVTAMKKVTFIVIIFMMLWRLIDKIISNLLASSEETTSEEDESSESEWGGAPLLDRTQTLLPIVRKFIGIIMIVMLTLFTLSSLGVNIAPLLAGAGVMGIAIGFGAQKLVSDLLSGFFYLIDDAFRVGEYIEAGSITGAVEKITLRNVMLRHHRGMLQIVPYGDLGAITNYMRGGIVVKFNLQFPYDTDVDQVRKIIKRVGIEMLADPELGKDFIKQIKSQGIREVGDSVLTIRVKFTANPGTHFVIRREAFKRITEALSLKGIHYAHRKVIVEVPGITDVQGGEGANQLTDEVKQKIAAAGAAAAIETQKKPV
jgi:small-conductance mechanosensitive channel